MANGYEILVTWPEVKHGQHRQETWYAHIPGQAEAVKAVENASGALNDAKIEILGPLLHTSLVRQDVREGEVRKHKDL